MRDIRLHFTPTGDREHDTHEFALRITAAGMQLFSALSHKERAALAESFCLYYVSHQAILAYVADDAAQHTLRTQLTALAEILDAAGISLESTSILKTEH